MKSTREVSHRTVRLPNFTDQEQQMVKGLYPCDYGDAVIFYSYDHVMGISVAKEENAFSEIPVKHSFLDVMKAIDIQKTSGIPPTKK